MNSGMKRWVGGFIKVLGGLFAVAGVLIAFSSVADTSPFIISGWQMSAGCAVIVVSIGAILWGDRLDR